MKRISTGFALLCAISISSLITGCGGSDSAQPGAQALALNTTVSGVAAAGAPIVGNAFLKDSSTPAVIKVVPIQSDGTFAFDTKELKAPFILRAEGMSAGIPQTLHSFAAGTGTANINPLSEVALADAAGVSAPADIYANPTPAMMTTLNDNLPAAIAALQAKLKPLMDRYGTSINPVYDSFSANHTGLDAMFDAVKITLIAGNVMLTNKTSNAVILNTPVNNMMAATLNMNALPSVTVPTPAQAATSSMYDTNCAGCHGPLATSSKKGATAAGIQAAIAANSGGMGRLSTLSATDIQAIVVALANTVTTASTATSSPPTTPASTTVDGKALYAADCAGCHGALANSSKLGRTAVQIQAANSSVGAMSSLSTMSSAQVQAIATALATTTPAPALTDGPTLYSTYCANCHDALASSSMRGKSASSIQSAINSVGTMRTIILTSAQIQTIANALK